MYADACVNIVSKNLNELLADLKNEVESMSNWMRIDKLWRQIREKNDDF